MFKNAILITATAAGMALGATGVARALDLPEFAPIPMSRTDASSIPNRAEIRHWPVIEIGTSPQAIPQERLSVRVIGTRFLPPLGESLDLKTRTYDSAGVVATLEDASVWLLRTASAGMFGEAIAAQDVASIEAD